MFENKKGLLILALFFALFGMAANVRAATADQYTVLLLHADGPSGTTNIIDNSSLNHSITVSGNVRHSDLRTKFGSSSLYFDGQGGYLELADSDDWYLDGGDWTVDFWMLPDDAAGRGLFGQSENVSGGPYFYLNLNAQGELVFNHYKVTYSTERVWKEVPCPPPPPDWCGSGCERYYTDEIDSHNEHDHCYNWVDEQKSTPHIDSFTSNQAACVPGQWYHIALVRSGDKMTIYRNGIAVGTKIVAVNYNQKAPLRIGISGSQAGFRGYLDEFRISRGIARWKSNFTPQTSAYGLSGVNLTADALVLNFGESTILHWDSFNASACVLEPGAITLEANGSTPVSPTATTTYIIKAIGDLDTATAGVTIKVKNGYDKANKFTINGKMGVGVLNPQEELEVNGTLAAKELQVGANGWADYVFDENYDLPALDRVEQSILRERKLPDMPTAAQLQAQDADLAEILTLQMRKIEELTLYLLREYKQNEALLNLHKQLQIQNELLRKRVNKLEEE